MDDIPEDATLDQMLDSGQQALAAGDRDAAYEIWRAAAVAHPYDERVWLALLQVLDRGDDRQVCLENIIAINPVNTEVRRQLRLLKRERRVTQEMRRTTAPLKPLAQPPRPTLRRAIILGIALGLLAVILGVVASIIVYGGLVALPTAVP